MITKTLFGVSGIVLICIMSVLLIASCGATPEQELQAQQLELRAKQLEVQKVVAEENGKTQRTVEYEQTRREAQQLRSEEFSRTLPLIAGGIGITGFVIFGFLVYNHMAKQERIRIRDMAREERLLLREQQHIEIIKLKQLELQNKQLAIPAEYMYLPNNERRITVYNVNSESEQ